MYSTHTQAYSITCWLKDLRSSQRWSVPAVLLLVYSPIWILGSRFSSYEGHKVLPGSAVKRSRTTSWVTSKLHVSVVYSGKSWRFSLSFLFWGWNLSSQGESFSFWWLCFILPNHAGTTSHSGCLPKRPRMKFIQNRSRNRGMRTHTRSLYVVFI